MKTWITKSGYKIIPILTGRSNVFLLTNDKQNILIDTSVKSDWNKLDKRLSDLNINLIDYLILTHTHFDHAGNAFRIKKKFHSQVIVQKSGVDYLTSGDNIIPNGTNVFTKILLQLFANKVFSKLRYEPCDFDILVDTHFDLNDFGFNAYIISTTGHSGDSISLIIDNEIAIVGDTMFGVFKWSIMPPFGLNINQLVDSWKKLLETNCDIFIPGHGFALNRLIVQKDYNKRNNSYGVQHTV